MIDSTDKKILKILQKNARTSNAEIARQIGIAPSAIFERIRKLEEKGIIESYNAKINRKTLGYGLTAFIVVRSDEGPYQYVLGNELANFPEVLEVHNTVGEDCYLIKVITKDTESLARLMRKRLKQLSHGVDTRTTIVVETTKESSEIPVEEED